MLRLYRFARRMHLVPNWLHELLRRQRSMRDMATRYDTLMDEVNYLRAALAELKNLYQSQQTELSRLSAAREQENPFK